MTLNYLIYLIAFLEGFTTLSVEIIWLRSFTPVVWANSVSTSIVLGVILLALSSGYYWWWKISASGKAIEQRLIVNLLLSSMYYFFITFIFAASTLESLLSLLGSYFFSLLISSVILFFIPVFLASQTIPLLSELLKWSHSGEKMWKLLFYSTIGSFIWAVGTSIILFPTFWVFKAWVVSSIFLAFCAVLLSLFLLKKNIKMQIFSWITLLFFLYVIAFFHPKNSNIIFETSNAYHKIQIYDVVNLSGNKRIFSLEWGYSSWIELETKNSFFKYIQEVEKQVKKLKVKDILVIWAAGFTFPNDVSEYQHVENIDVIDVDKSLKKIAEKYFLEKKLSSKIHFYPTPSRYFLNSISEKKYDAILVDAYSGKSLPPQTLTYEFFKQLSEVGENVYLNIIIDKNLKSDFANNLFTTVKEGFWEVYYKDVTKDLNKFTNIIITNKKHPWYEEIKWTTWKTYHDDRHSIELDLFKLNALRYGKN